MDRLNPSSLLDLIPQKEPFRFVDKIEYADAEKSKGSYFFKKDEYFYKGHFPDIPITPSVILVEAMAQIGLIPLGIMNMAKESAEMKKLDFKPIFTNSEVKFVNVVYPETKIIVEAEKVFFRLNRLKAKVKLFNSEQKLCASGTLSGVILTNKDFKI